MMTVFREYDGQSRLQLEVIDNEDGTGTRTDYTTDPPTATQLTGLPIIPPPEPTDSEKLATLLAALTGAQSLEEIRDAAAAAGGN